MAVLQFPGPNGARPSVLAKRADISKQAMNQLLRSLESRGYIVRSDLQNESNARVIRLTKRGRAIDPKMVEILRAIERSGAPSLGPSASLSLKSC